MHNALNTASQDPTVKSMRPMYSPNLRLQISPDGSCLQQLVSPAYRIQNSTIFMSSAWGFDVSSMLVKLMQPYTGTDSLLQ